jgi:excisionase family DNA binding protein
MQSSTLFQTTPENLVELLRIAVREELLNYQTPVSTPDEELLTPAEACAFLKITKTTIWRWQKEGKIDVFGTGKIRFYKKTDLLNLLILKK